MRYCFLNMYMPIFDLIGEPRVTLREIFWVPYTRLNRSHITCSRKKVKKK